MNCDWGVRQWTLEAVIQFEVRPFKTNNFEEDLCLKKTSDKKKNKTKTTIYTQTVKNVLNSSKGRIKRKRK